MNVGFRRFVAAFSLVALVSVIAAAPANAATPTGVGTSGGAVSLAGLDYGAIIKATLLGENNSDTIDPLKGTPTAIETLSPLSTHTALLGDLSLPVVKTTTTGPLDQKNVAQVDLSTLGVPGLNGKIIPATLRALVDSLGS